MRYFLHSEGHGASDYGKVIGAGMSWGEKIIPMTEADVLEWWEKRQLEPDELPDKLKPGEA